MHLDKIIALLPYYLEANIALEIRGKSGIGKTDMIREWAASMHRKTGSFGIGTHFAATWTPPDVTGFLAMRTALLNGRETMMSEWALPTWLRADPGQDHEWMNDFQQGVLVLEEYDKTGAEVKKAAAPLVLEGGLQGNYLHKRIMRIMLTNHADDGRQGSTKDFDFSINRRHIVDATQSVQGWVMWATANGVHPMFVAFAEEHPDVVFGGQLPEKQGPFCTARSLTSLQKVVQLGVLDPDGRIADEEAFAEMSAGSIGGPASRALITFLKFKDEVPNWNEIRAKPSEAKVPANPGAQMMAAHICAFNVDDKNVEQAVIYVRRLSKQFHIVFAKAASRRNFRVVNSKPFIKWTSDQPELVALLNVLGGAR